MKNKKMFGIGAVVLILLLAMGPIASCNNKIIETSSQQNEISNGKCYEIPEQHGMLSKRLSLNNYRELLQDVTNNLSIQGKTIGTSDYPCQFDDDWTTLLYCCGIIYCDEGTIVNLPIGFTPIYPFLYVDTNNRVTISAECFDGHKEIDCPNGATIMIIGFVGVVLSIPIVSPFFYAEGCWFLLSVKCK